MTFPDPGDPAETLITHANCLSAVGAAGLICAHRSWLTDTDCQKPRRLTSAGPSPALRRPRPMPADLTRR